MKTILATLLVLCAGLAAVATLESQRLRRELDLCRGLAAASEAEARLAWQQAHQLRATLAALDGPQPDPAASIEFLDR